ncbi:tRNA lysidine(34) synthetase TilS [Blautia obeum]|mgnify:FL=1|uniref:tRNA lysidine(34) synthetase TilS n=1 Tax=Blautia obeum TaxID=40520 RepID=UPI001D07DC9C|nr:tRNA lysidine(34) synthetase TilS [Blautia obeum]MCB7341318.1 tRNA lysidine(34) synthetase TilS [Blautia obeum]
MREKTFDKVKDFVKENEMLARNCAVIAGVSGGNDSMTMLHLLRRLREIWHFHLQVVHVNHGIRGAEADRDQRMVETVCTESNIPCSVYRYDVPELSVKWKLGTEETGRIVRRQAFDAETHKCRKQYAVVRTALAHNKNDLAETMLHHLARGTGLRGLCSLKPVNGEVIRPLLCLERREIDDYIRECGIPSVLDSTNLEDEYTRNRIRRHLLPVMEREINAKTVEHMAETSRLLSEAEEFLTDEAAQLAADYREPDGSYCLGEGFFQKKQILKSYGVRTILEKLSGRSRDLTQTHIRQVLELYSCRVSKRISLPYGLEAVRTYDGVILRKKIQQKPGTEGRKEQEIPLPATSEEVETPFGRFTIKVFSYSGEKILEKKYTKWFDCDKIKCGLSVRTRKTGDYLIVGRDGGRKKLTRCMIDDKFPKETRDQVPLIADGGEILWIIGGRISERYKITSCTRNVLEITYQGGTRL